MNIATLTATYRADDAPFRQTTERVRGELGAMERQFGQVGRIAERVFIGMLAYRGLDLVFKGIGSAVIGFNATLEQASIGFTTLLGSAQAAGSFLQQLKQFAVQTPFQFGELIDASRRMLALGFSAQQVLPLLTAIGDATAALGTGSEGLNRITLALGQMTAKTKVQAEEMRQLTEAGIPAWQILARTLGTDVAGAMDRVTARTVDAKTFLDAFMRDSVSRFGGMMQAQSRTFLGAISNIKDAIDNLGSTAFKPLYDIITRTAVRLADFLGSDQAQQWATTFASGLQEVIDRIQFLFRSVSQFVGAGDDRRFTILRRLGIDPNSAREIVGILNGLSRDIPGTLLRIGRLALDAFQRAFGPFGTIIQNTLETQVRRPLLTFVAENVERFADNAGRLLTAFFDALGGRRGRGQIGGLDPYVQRVYDAFGRAFGAIGDWFLTTGIPNLEQKVGGAWHRFWEGGALGADSRSKIALLGVNVQQGLEDSFGAVGKALFGTGLRGQLEEMLAPLLDWGRQAKDAGISFVAGLIEGINGKLADLQGALQGVVDLVNGAVGGINTAIGAINSTLQVIPKMPGAPGAPTIPAVPTVPAAQLPQVPALPSELQPPPQPQPPTPEPPSPPPPALAPPAPPAPAIQLPQLPTPQLPQIEIPDPIEAARRAAEAARAAWDAFIGGIGPGPGQPVAPLSPPVPAAPVAAAPVVAAPANVVALNPATAGLNQWQDLVNYYAQQYAAAHPGVVPPETLATAVQAAIAVEHRIAESGPLAPAALQQVSEVWMTPGGQIWSPSRPGQSPPPGSTRYGAVGLGQALPNFYTGLQYQPGGATYNTAGFQFNTAGTAGINPVPPLSAQAEAAVLAMFTKFAGIAQATPQYTGDPYRAAAAYYGAYNYQTGQIGQRSQAEYLTPGGYTGFNTYYSYGLGGPLPTYQVPEGGALPDATVPATQNRVQAAQAIIAKAAQYLGVAYKLGGTDFSGIDCSNLVQQAYSAAGLNLPAPTYSQFNESQVIPQSEARPGDLVFFKNTYTPEGLGWIKKTYGEQAAQFTHVGLYLGEQNGQPMMLDASGNKVAYHNINDPYWQAHSPTFARPNVLAGLPDAFQKVAPTVEANTAAIQMLTDAIRGLMGLPGVHGAPPPPPITPPVTPLSIAEAVANRITDIHDTQPQGAVPFADQFLSGLTNGRKSFPWEQFDSAAASELYRPLRSGAENMVLGALREVTRPQIDQLGQQTGQQFAAAFGEAVQQEWSQHPIFDPKQFNPLGAVDALRKMGVPESQINRVLGFGRSPLNVAGWDNPLMALDQAFEQSLGLKQGANFPLYQGVNRPNPLKGQPGQPDEIPYYQPIGINIGGYGGVGQYAPVGVGQPAPSTGGGLGGTQQGQISAPADPRVISILEGILRAVQEGQTLTIDQNTIGRAVRDYETQESRLVYG